MSSRRARVTRLILAANADYEAFRSRIEDAASGRERPFASWLGAQGRIFFPLGGASDSQPGTTLSKDDEDVIETLREFGYEVADYRTGTCTDKYGRIVRIG